MSKKLTKAILALPNPWPQKAVLVSLAQYAKDATSVCFRSLAQLEADCSMSKNTVRSALKILKATGLLIEAGKTRYGIAQFRINLPLSGAPPRGAADDTVGVSGAAIAAADRGSGAAPGGISSCTGGYQELIQGVAGAAPDYRIDIEIIRKEKEIQAGLAKKTGAASVCDFSSFFLQFWEAYPVHEREAKARTEFSKVCKDEPTLGLMLDALERQKRERELKAEKGIWAKSWREPTNWLRERGWLDPVLDDEALEAIRPVSAEERKRQAKEAADAAMLAEFLRMTDPKESEDEEHDVERAE